VPHDPGVRLRDIAVSVGITEPSAYDIVTDLTVAGYVIKEKDGRRNRYQIQAYLALPELICRERTLGEVLASSPAPTRRLDRSMGRHRSGSAGRLPTARGGGGGVPCASGSEAMRRSGR
jgi:hypothetical protein